MDRWTDGRMDATKCNISLASWLIKTHFVLFPGHKYHKTFGVIFFNIEIYEAGILARNTFEGNKEGVIYLLTLGGINN